MPYSYADARGKSDQGVALFVYSSTLSKYTLLCPAKGLPAMGAAPGQIETTTTTSATKVYAADRKDNPQGEVAFNVHRDNLKRLNDFDGTDVEMLVLYPDYTGYTFTATINVYANEVTVGGAIEGSISITKKTTPVYVDDCYAIIADTVEFAEGIPEEITVAKAGTDSFTVTTTPSDATVTPTSSDTDVATVAILNGVVTVTGVDAGSCIITLTGSKATYASWSTYLLVVCTG